jgi:hypothetical protein
MILEKQTETTVIEYNKSKESIGMSLDLNSAQILMQMLSKNLYSDSIGSTIRECASNALDSHRRAQVKVPIVVSLLSNESYNYEFTVEDFGTGLDSDDVANIISKYGKSTKRESNVEIGAMGLGFKSPLSYSSSFYFVCRKNGIERKYMMYEGEDVNSIDLLYEQNTDEQNGVKIIIPIKYNDVYQFRKKIKEQLCYFEDVYFNVKDDSSITNDFVILRHKDFQFSELSTDNCMHICLDNVYYSIDYSKLGIDVINCPIALRFSLSDGLYPTPNRENLRYTKEARDIILEKLKTVSNYFIEEYNKSILKSNNIKQLILCIEDSSKKIKLSDSKLINVLEFKKYSTCDFKTLSLKGLKLYKFESLYYTLKIHLLGRYVKRFKVKNDKIKMSDKYSEPQFSVHKIAKDETKIYLYSDKVSKIKKDYLRFISNSEDCSYLVTKREPMTLGNFKKFDTFTYYHILTLHKYPKKEWRQRIKECQLIFDLFSEQFIDLDKFIVPQTFIDTKNRKKISKITHSLPKKIKLKGDIQGKESAHLLKYNGNNCKFVPTIYKIEDIHKYKGLTIYSEHSDASQLDLLYSITYDYSKMRHVTFSTRELKIVEGLEIQNLISLKTFMEGNTKPFKRSVTAYLISKLISKYYYTFNCKNSINYVSKDFSEKLLALDTYSKNYKQSGGNEELYKEMKVIAEKYDLFDSEIYSEYLEMKETLSKLSFIEPMMQKIRHVHSAEDPILNVLADLFKYYKYKVNLNHYGLKKNEEIFTEENIDQLLD